MIKLWRKEWFRRQRRFKRSMRGGRLHAILGKHAFHPKVWKSDKRSIAGGLAAGLFIAMTPTIPAQMLLAAVAAIYFRVNLPIALAACWVTNPLTAVPIYVASQKLGKAMLTRSDHIAVFVDLFVPTGQMGRIIRGGIYLSTGSLVLAVLAAGIGYLSVQVLWAVMERFGVIRKRLPQGGDTGL